ncbi:MAG: N-acetylmuramoyl-L-alanine amidase, partial [Pseudomonadota bacterium]
MISVLISLPAAANSANGDVYIGKPGHIGKPAGSKSASLPQKPERTRFIIGLPEAAKYDVATLPNSNRVIVEIESPKILLPRLPTGGPVGLVKHFQGGSAGNGKSRVIISVTDPVVIDSSKVVRVGQGQGRAHHLILEFLPAQSLPVKTAGLPGKFKAPFGLGATNEE